MSFWGPEKTVDPSKEKNNEQFLPPTEVHCILYYLHAQCSEKEGSIFFFCFRMNDIDMVRCLYCGTCCTTVAVR